MAKVRETNAMSSDEAQMPAFAGVVRGGRIRLLDDPCLPDGTRVLVTVMPEWLRVDMVEFSAAELAGLATAGGSFDRLAAEPELFSDADLQERFDWTR